MVDGTISGMKNRWKSFVFENFSWDALTQKLALRYSFDGEVMFEENWSFEFEISPEVNEAVLMKAFEGLWLAAGVSYFKAALPQEIRFNENFEATNYKLQITKEKARFFEKVWQNGLGEFFY